jgi:hypothetical protein
MSTQFWVIGKIFHTCFTTMKDSVTSGFHITQLDTSCYCNCIIFVLFLFGVVVIYIVCIKSMSEEWKTPITIKTSLSLAFSQVLPIFIPTSRKSRKIQTKTLLLAKPLLRIRVGCGSNQTKSKGYRSWATNSSRYVLNKKVVQLSNAAGWTIA